MATVRDDAICLRVWEWSETSQTVALFSRQLGVVRALAKGARRNDARFSGGLEITSRGEMVAILKANERSTDSLATLAAWDLREVFPSVRASLAVFHGALYAVDLVFHAIRDSDPHPEVYESLLSTLRAMTDSASVAAALLGFQWDTLRLTGYRPELDRDVSGGDLGAAAVYRFSPSLGGLVGETSGKGVDPGQLWKVRAETVGVLRGLDRDLPEGRDSGVARNVRSAPADAVDRANRFLAWYLRTVLGTWPRSVQTAFPGIAEVEP